jgi:hypothetical protein
VCPQLIQCRVVVAEAVKRGVSRPGCGATAVETIEHYWKPKINSVLQI